MAPPVRLRLLHGADAEASSDKLNAWEGLFEAKYGGGGRTVIQADELDAAACVSAFRGALETPSLFSPVRLVTVRRASPEAARQLLPHLSAAADTTIIFWNPEELKPEHPLLKRFGDPAARGSAELFAMPDEGTFKTYLGLLLQAEDAGMEAAAATALTAEYFRRGKALRAEARLKPTEPLRSDPRSSWMRQTVRAAALRADGPMIGLPNLRAAGDDQPEPVVVFELVNAARRADWKTFRSRAAIWEGAADEGEYFTLWALLRRQYRQEPEARAPQRAVRLLAQMDLAAKNGGGTPDELTALFPARMEAEQDEILPLRTLWKLSLV